MNKWLVVVCCAFSVVSLGASAEVYKWKDSSGKTHYSDTPPTSNVPFGTLSGKKRPAAPEAAQQEPAATGDVQAGATPAAEPKGGDVAASKDAAAKKRAQEEAAAKDAEIKRLQDERAAIEKKIKDQNCKNARARVAQFEQGGRMYRIDENGERQYYGDEEIASGLAQAKADVEANCTE